MFSDPPTASAVTVSGSAVEGMTLTGSYTYADPDDDAEGTSTFQWYRADDADGTNAAAISDATATSYTVTSDDVGSYLAFEVTPVAADGKTDGEVMRSAYTEAAAISAAGLQDSYGTMVAVCVLEAMAVGFEQTSGDGWTLAADGNTVTMTFTDYVLGIEGEAVTWVSDVTFANRDDGVESLACSFTVTTSGTTSTWEGTVTVDGVQVDVRDFSEFWAENT